ncbi:TPA: EAL domain-containing protein [Citrobacter freundii]|nr:EAL domain-containing protein [Citrobacter freundii]
MFHDRSTTANFIIIWISNLGDIATAFGSELHLTCIAAIRQRLMSRGFPAAAIELQDEVVTIDLAMLSYGLSLTPDQIGNYPTNKQEDKLASFIQAIIGTEPIDTLQGYVYLRVEVRFLQTSGAQSGFTDRGMFLAEQSHRRPALVPGVLDAWCRRFRIDMRLAANLLDDLRNGSLILAFQPVVRFIDGEAVCVYNEALLRNKWDLEQPTYAPEDAIVALEKLGLISRLDYSVISTVLELLRHQPNQHIAANISAVSLNYSPFWRHLMEQLKSMPDIACRLILEITETAEIGRIHDAINLLERLKKIGVRIAIDDVGAGMTTLEFIATVHADIIKIDRSVLLRSCSPHADVSELDSLVCLCKNYGRFIIIEGIETPEQLHLAINSAGANAIQGYLIGPPEVQTVWMKITPCHIMDVYDQFQPLKCIEAIQGS